MTITTEATTTSTDSAATTLAENPFVAARRWPEGVAYRFFAEGEWQDQTFAEYAESVRSLARGLIAAGLEPGEGVAILGNTRPEWGWAMHAVLAAGGVLSSIYPTNSPAECAWVLADSGAVILIAETEEMLARTESVRDQTPELRKTFLIDPGTAAPTLADLEALGESVDPEEVDRRVAAVKPEDVAILIYTSGTTGRAKGCMLTHRNIISVPELANVVMDGSFMSHDDITFNFLPMAHLLGQGILHWSMLFGATAGFGSKGAANVMADFQALKPTMIPSVPRIFEKVYAALTAQVPPEMLKQAVDAGMRKRALEIAGDPVPAELAAAVAKADEALFSKVRAIFGGNVRYMMTGAAPMADDIMALFWASGVPITEAWGMTESSGLGTINAVDKFKFGTVGLPECEIRLAEDGELLMRGANVFAGYWNNPEATAETVIDGWLHTGDLGAIDDEGYVTIVGRKKDIIITAAGKNLTPANLENGLMQHPFIANALMCGDRRPYPVALITLDPETVIPWAKEQGLPTDIAALSQEPAVRQLVQDHLDEVNSNFSTVTRIKRFTILPHDFTIESGELTPTMKMKRQVINDKYASVLDELYAAPRQS